MLLMRYRTRLAPSGGGLFLANVDALPAEEVEQHPQE
jgi:hypothetical protein